MNTTGNYLRKYLIWKEMSLIEIPIIIHQKHVVWSQLVHKIQNMRQFPLPAERSFISSDLTTPRVLLERRQVGLQKFPCCFVKFCVVWFKEKFKWNSGTNILGVEMSSTTNIHFVVQSLPTHEEMVLDR